MNPIRFERLILHPGSPKTGTSGLQNFLFRKRDALNNLGYLYPMSGIDMASGTAKGQHSLAFSIDPNAPAQSATFEELIEGLRSEIETDPSKTVILSSEEFFSDKRIAVLKQYLQPDACQIYVNMRPQYEVMNANYYTQVTHNRSKHIPETYFDFAINRLGYRKNIIGFSQFAPQTEVNLRVFERGQPVRKDPIADFIKVMGIDLEYNPEENIVEHPTLPATATLFLRMLNDLEFSPQDFFDVFQDLHKMRPTLPKQIYTMSPGRMRAVVEAFEQDNIWLRENFGDGKTASLFSSPQYPDEAEWEKQVGSDLAALQQQFLGYLCARAEGRATTS